MEKLKKPRTTIFEKRLHFDFVVTTKTRKIFLLEKEVTHHVPVLDLFLVLGLMSLWYWLRSCVIKLTFLK